MLEEASLVVDIFTPPPPFLPLTLEFDAKVREVVVDGPVDGADAVGARRILARPVAHLQWRARRARDSCERCGGSVCVLTITCVASEAIAVNLQRIYSPTPLVSIQSPLLAPLNRKCRHTL